MSSNDTPFGALDKMLFSSAPAKKKEPKKVERSKTTKSKRRPKKILSPPADQASRPVKSTNIVDQHDQPIDQTRPSAQTNQSTQSTKQIDLSTGQLSGSVVKRPLAFYIPLSINEKLEEAVSYYQKKYNRKIDRSAVISALLGNPDIWSQSALDQLADKVLDQLKNRFNDRLMDRLKQSTG
jgi:hypothetical protein